MGTTLTGTTPQDTYEALIKVGDNGIITGSLKTLSDGEGHDTALALSTGAASVTGTLAVSGDVSIADKIIHTGDTNTAIRFPAADTITFETSGTEAARITSTGNVGIGTSAPAAKLEVSGAFSSVRTSIIGIEDTAHVYRGTPDGTGFEHAKVLSGRDATTFSYGSFLAFHTEGKSSGTTDTSTEKARIDSNGYLRMAASTGGIQFNGDTAAANALDDYEEGTFTPTIAGTTTAGTATYTTQVGKYTKIGRQVSCQIDLGYNSGTGTGDLSITGLPFTDSSAANPSVTIGYFEQITLTASNYALAYLASSSTRIDFVQIPAGGGSLTSIAYDAAGRIIVNVTYTA